MPGCAPYAVTLHGIEVKVQKSDLARDTKHLEYEPFCDFCWYAMPRSVYRAVEADADEWLSEGWGVLVLEHTGRLTVAREAKRNLAPAMRDAALMTALVRLA